MALETATYIDGLVATNPAASDAISTADDHLRLIKSTVKATFPSLTGPVTKTQAQINDLLEKSGGTMTGALVLSGAPTADLNPASKKYVDDADALKADKATTITAGTGLSGGGDLSANRTVSIAAGGVGTTQLANSGVTTAKIADANVTAAKLASGAAVSNIGYTPVNSSAFTGSNQSLGSSGYQKLPGGLIIQWGSGTTSSSTLNVTFPIAFPTAVVSVQVSMVGGGSGESVTIGSTPSTSGVQVKTEQSSRPVYWTAIGY